MPKSGHFYFALTPPVFWLEVKEALSNGNLLINNLPERGKTKISKVEEVVEPDLIYPTLRGADIKRWKGVPKIYVLITHPASQIPYSLDTMRQNWPRTFSYLTRFKDILMQSSLYRHFHKSAGNPFYGQRNINDNTFRNYKVVWKIMANDLIATVVSQYKTLFGYKAIIPLKTTAFAAINDESEAHYLCAIINSNPVREFIKSFSSAGRGFGTPSVMEHLAIPKFEPKKKLHRELAEISKKCHRLKAEDKEKEIEKLEEENDELVSKLFGIEAESQA